MAGLAFGGYLAFGFDWVGHGFISLKKFRKDFWYFLSKNSEKKKIDQKRK